MYYINNWFYNILGSDWSFSFDALSAVMLCVVSTVSFLVHCYSTQYMASDQGIVRFFTYLSLFTICMYILVLSNNIFGLFVGWEGVGLCSYLLINFWFTRLQANKAALKAMVVNRVGDVSLILAFGLTLCVIGSLNFPVYIVGSSLLHTADFFSFSIVFSCIFYFFAAVGKSAQIGLHTWLPDAMEGPTPVSALIHAATMVTAGVFLLIRISTWLNLSVNSLILIAIGGAVTAMFAGSVGLFQYDIKKVVAYSTCSQLGYMILICGISAYSVGLFHLFNHAFFKALLFLGSGSIIHGMADEQDMRKYGRLNLFTPLINVAFLFASIALLGLPFFAGFYSKDSVLEIVVSTYSSAGLWSYWLGLVAALMTAGYSVKVILWTFESSALSFKNMFQAWHAPSNVEYFVFTTLIVLSVFSGYIFRDIFIGFGANFFDQFVGGQLSGLQSAEFLPQWIKLLPLIGSLCMLPIAFVIFGTDIIFSKALVSTAVFELVNFLSHKWYFNLIYNYYISLGVMGAGYSSFWVWDRYILEQVQR